MTVHDSRDLDIWVNSVIGGLRPAPDLTHARAVQRAFAHQCARGKGAVAVTTTW